MNQPFAFGGEEGKEAFDEQIIYRSSLQNFLIDTGQEVILVDTGFKASFPAPAKKLGAPLYMGEKVMDYMDAFDALDYKPEQVTKILITHKHPDHSDCIGYFPNAKIYIGTEDADAMKLEGENIVRAQFGESYKNFPNAQQVAPGIWFVEAKGHTKGNSIVIAEDEGIFYMFHGDVLIATLHSRRINSASSSRTRKLHARRSTASASSSARTPPSISQPIALRDTRTWS